MRGSVIDKLSMVIAYIALKSNNTIWDTSINDIILYGSTDQRKCNIALIIIKNIALIFDQEIFDSRTSAIMSNFLRENLPLVLEFLNKIIGSPDQVPK